MGPLIDPPAGATLTCIPYVNPPCIPPLHLPCADHHHPDAFFDFAKSWWDVRDEPNVLLLHFNELKNESRMRTIERIADFLELHPVSDQLLGEVYRKSSYEVLTNVGTILP